MLGECVVKQMNLKELNNLEHYRYLIENRKFDEYDIIGFLVLIREYIDRNLNPLIHDIADGTAHRKRNRGKIYDSMYYAVLNNYSIDKNGHIEGYHGILNNEWKTECLNLSQQFHIKITPIISSELAICMFSIIHRSEYETNSKSHNKEVPIKGSIEMLVNKDTLSISTSDDINKLQVCFMKIANVEIINDKPFIVGVVGTYRKNKFLYLKSDDGDILKVTKRK